MKQPSTDLPLIHLAQDKELSPLHADFNRKIQKISALKTQIAEVKAQRTELQQLIHKELAPLEQEHTAERVALVKAMANAYHQLKMTKGDREELQDMMLHEAWELITQYRQDELKAIYDQFSAIPIDEEITQMQEERKQATADMFERMTGIHIEDLGLGDDFHDMSEMERMQRLKAAYEEKQRQHAWENSERTKKRKAKQSKAQVEADLMARGSRSIYMELAKELHPDREPDEEKKAFKTELMQRATAAYQKNDLFELLRLRLEYKQSIEVEGLPEEQIKLYLKVLQEQINNLKNEYSSYLSPLNPENRRLLWFGLGKKKNASTRLLNQEKRQIQEKVKALQHLRQFTMKNERAFKDYMKQLRQDTKHNDGFNGFFDYFFGL